MQRSRADQILADWDTIARQAVPPGAAPRRQVMRSALPSLSMLGTALVVLALVAASIWINLPGGGAPVGASPTPMATPAPTPSPSAPPSPGPTPSPTPFAIGTPRPGDFTTATELARQYQTALSKREWRTAWDLLAPEAQAHWGSYAAFVYDRSAFDPLRGPYSMAVATHDQATIARWVVPDYPITADLGRAFIVQVDYPETPPPGLVGGNAWEVLLVAPEASGRWSVWQLR